MCYSAEHSRRGQDLCERKLQCHCQVTWDLESLLDAYTFDAKASWHACESSLSRWKVLTCHRQAQARRLWFSCLSWFWNLPNCCSQAMWQGRQNQPFPNPRFKSYLRLHWCQRKAQRPLYLQHWRRSENVDQSSKWQWVSWGAVL